MIKKLTFWSGILGVALFASAAVLGGYQIADYSHISQLLSESYAIGTPYGSALRFFGYIPSGICLTLFAFLAIKSFPKSNPIKIGLLCWGFSMASGPS